MACDSGQGGTPQELSPHTRIAAWKGGRTVYSGLGIWFRFCVAAAPKAPPPHRIYATGKALESSYGEQNLLPAGEQYLDRHAQAYILSFYLYSMTEIYEGDVLEHLSHLSAQGRLVHLTFLDPPFNQGKAYNHFSDDLPEATYWEWMRQVCERVYELTETGGAIYFMQREKNTENVLRILRETGWTFQNLIIWAKRTSAVPGEYRYGKQYQIIAFATKGDKPRVFHRLRIDAPLRPEYKLPRQESIFVTDVWDDIQRAYFWVFRRTRSHSHRERRTLS